MSISRTVTKLSEANDGDVVRFIGDVFVERRFKGEGEPYLVLTMSDRTAAVTSVCFCEAPLYPFFNAIEDEARIEAVGKIVKNGKFRNIQVYEAKISEREDNWVVQLNKLITALGRIIRGIKHDGLRDMLYAHFKNKELNSAYFNAPLTIDGGGNFKGGLLAHAVRMCRLIDSTWNVVHLYGEEFNVNTALKTDFNKDLLKAVVLLEGVGKVDTIKMKRHKPVLTKKGELLSPRIITMQIVQKLLDESSLNEDEKLLFLHVLAAVHENDSFTGQVPAKSREAVILNNLYQMNVQLMMFERLDKERALDSPEDEFYFHKRRNYYLSNFDEFKSVEEVEENSNSNIEELVE